MTASVVIGGVGAGFVLWYTGHRWPDRFFVSVAVYCAASFVIRLIIGRPSGWWYTGVAIVTAAAIATLVAGWRWVQRRRRPPRGGPSGWRRVG